MKKFWVNPLNRIWWHDKWWDKEIAYLRTAKKDWICDECFKEIKKGSKYVDDVFIVNDFLFSKSYHHRVCLKCWKIKFW